MILKMTTISSLLCGSDIDFQRQCPEKMGYIMKANPCLEIIPYQTGF